MPDILTAMAEAKPRLAKQREELKAQVRDLECAIANVDHHLAAIAAYETALNGKVTTKTPRGSKRAAVLTIVKDNAGITRGGIIEKLTAQGHDSPEKGLSNMLNALKTTGKITASEGKYAPVA